MNILIGLVSFIIFVFELKRISRANTFSHEICMNMFIFIPVLCGLLVKTSPSFHACIHLSPRGLRSGQCKRMNSDRFRSSRDTEKRATAARSRRRVSLLSQIKIFVSWDYESDEFVPRPLEKHERPHQEEHSE